MHVGDQPVFTHRVHAPRCPVTLSGVPWNLLYLYFDFHLQDIGHLESSISVKSPPLVLSPTWSFSRSQTRCMACVLGSGVQVWRPAKWPTWLEIICREMHVHTQWDMGLSENWKEKGPVMWAGTETVGIVCWARINTVSASWNLLSSLEASH